MCGIGFMEHFMVNRLDEQYQHLLQNILEYGVNKQDRTGTGTKSIFGYMIHHNMKNGFPLLTTKKVPFKTMATELMWFLMGDTNIKYLVDNNCHIWDGDAYKAYIKRYNKGEYVGKTKLLENSKKNRTLTEPFTQEEFINKIKTDDEFAKTWGELGPIYGRQWRSWADYYNGSGEYTDQIANLISELKTNPDSRRLMVNAWNVAELEDMVLPPCHYGFQVYTRPTTRDEKIVNPGKYRAISLAWNQRSVDVFLGLPFNIASYGLLLEMIAREVNMVPEHLIGHLGDTHLYSNHIEQAKEQISRESKDLLPTLKMSSGHNFRAAMKSNADEIDLNDFILLGYDPHPAIKAPLSN
jgi:thymidylate synthase